MLSKIIVQMGTMGHNKSAMPKKEKTTVPALQKGLKVLELLADSGEFLNLSGIARMAGYKVSEIQRVVGYLYAEGYIRRTRNGAYYLGSRFYNLTLTTDPERYLKIRASQALNRFTAETGESIHLTMLVDRQLRLLLQHEGSSVLRMSLKPGIYDPRESVSGMLLLSQLSSEAIEVYDLEERQSLLLPEIRAEYRKGGSYLGESHCVRGLYNLATLLPVPGSDAGAALTVTFLEPRETPLTDYTAFLKEHLLKARDEIL